MFKEMFDNWAMRILVTGGAGFLGSHLCERLLREGHKVTVLDSLQTGSLRNIAHLKKNMAFEFIKGDVTERYQLSADWIFNMACPASPVQYQKNPLKTISTSLLGMDNACRCAIQNGGRVLQASTSEIYGDPTVHPQPESYWGHVNTLGPRACYDEGKRASETLCMEYNRQLGLDVRIARIFNTYGPRMALDDGRVVSNFIIQALKNRPITVYGQGRQTRSFCYVDDLIEGILRMMKQKKTVGPVNIGNPGEFTILELAEAVLELTKSRSKIIFKPLPADDPRQRCPDISLARKVLGGWRPKVQLREGLEKTIAYFKGVLR